MEGRFAHIGVETADVVDWSSWLDLDGEPDVSLDEEWPGPFGAAVRGMP